MAVDYIGRGKKSSGARNTSRVHFNDPPEGKDCLIPTLERSK